MQKLEMELHQVISSSLLICAGLFSKMLAILVFD